MTTSGSRPLTWSSQFSILPIDKTPFLKGDKIVLPPSVLEQLLAAATTTVSRTAYPQTSTFDPYNPYSFAAERDARSEIVERQQQLPHPLTFRLVNPINGRIVYAGIREFSAEDQKVGLSSFLRHSLGIEEHTAPVNVENDMNGIISEEDSTVASTARITIHIKELPKGTYVKLRSLEAGYDPDDWKALLEKYLRENFTTLTNGEILSIPTGKEDFRFLVDGLRPDNEAISLVDTDLEVDIEALNEEQARETLKRRVQKSQQIPGTSDGSSVGGTIEIGMKEIGQVRPGEYVDYALNTWDRNATVELEISSLNEETDLDLFVNAFGPRQRSRPREKEHVFGDFSGSQHKRIKIDPSNSELDNVEALWISVRGYRDPSIEEHDTELGSPIPYQLQIISSVGIQNPANKDRDIDENGSLNSDEDRCKNCHQLVPRRTMILHENFCFRNNVLCLKCKNVFQKSSTEWKDHWHCAYDESFGNSQRSRSKHDTLFHTLRTCLNCNYQATNAPDLAHHSTTTCPGKLILCSFCHLQVPQQGPDDPALSDPEVILSGLTPHELVDGARTTECHICAKITRLRDMPTHLKHHDLQRLSRVKPRICRNANCGRTLDSIDKNGETRYKPLRNELGVCDTCFGPLYVSLYDPDGKALKRRVERKYLTQLLTGCGQSWCKNPLCKTGRKNLAMDRPGGLVTSKEALGMVKPILDQLKELEFPVNFCSDEASQQRRSLAEMISAEGEADGVEREQLQSEESGYELEWCIAALEVAGGDLDRARSWLNDWAPTRKETR